MPVETIQCPRSSSTVFFECPYKVQYVESLIPSHPKVTAVFPFDVLSTGSYAESRVDSTDRLPESFP